MSDRRATLVRQAARLFGEGPVDAAIAAHHALLDAYPDDPDSWYNLALLERRARRPAASLVALDEALARGIMGAEEVWLQRGVVLSDDLGDADGARIALGQALALAPAYLPALLNLGNLEEDGGDRVAAEHQYRAALAAAPGHPLALARLAGVAAISQSDDPLLDALRRALGQARGDPLAEADLGFALGHALDRIGDYDAAFDAYVAANRASRAFAVTQGQGYDRAAHEQWIDRLIAAFPSPAQSKGEGGDAPIFVCGMVRSGSTLAERMLSRHGALVAGGELDVVPAIAAEIIAYPEAVGGLDETGRQALATRYRSETNRRGMGGRRLIDKRPDNILHLGLVRALFPGARIVRTVRAPLDNLLSAFFLHADPTLAWATDLSDIAHYLAQERRLAAAAQARLGPIYDLHYERLVTDTRGEMAALLAFCGLDWDEAVLDPAAGGGAVRTASVWQVREPIHRRSSGRWRHYADRLGEFPALFEDIA